MAKIILLLLAVAAIFWFLSGRHKNPPAKSPKAAGAAEKMVVCAHCHLHVPESESIKTDSRYFCCDEHRRLGPS